MTHKAFNSPWKRIWLLGRGEVVVMIWYSASIPCPRNWGSSWRGLQACSVCPLTMRWACVNVPWFLVGLAVGIAKQFLIIQAGYWFLWVWRADLIYLWFSFGSLSTFIKTFEGFYFKLIKGYGVEYSILKNNRPVACGCLCRSFNDLFSPARLGGPWLVSCQGFLLWCWKDSSRAGPAGKWAPAGWTRFGFPFAFIVSRLFCSRVCMRSWVYTWGCRPGYHILLLPHNSSFWLSLVETAFYRLQQIHM